MTTHSLADLARATGLALLGDGCLRVGAPAEPAIAGADDLAIAMDKRYEEALRRSAAKAAIVWDGADLAEFGLLGALVATRPRVALARITQAYDTSISERAGAGIHPSAIIAAGAVLGADVTIGPLTVIETGAIIGAGSQVGAHVSIGRDASIGPGSLLHDGVRIGARCKIGARFIGQPNAIIGPDGFSFEPPERGSVEAVKTSGAVTSQNALGFLRIHSLAAVEIGDDVEIGSCTTIDRGTISPTRIGSGTKIDNQVQIGHNVQIGRTCLICAQVGIAGSATIGDRVVLGGRVGIGDHLSIGDDAVCAAGTLLAGNVAPRTVMMGIPGTTRQKAIEQIIAVRRLPKLAEQVAEIRKKLGL